MNSQNTTEEIIAALDRGEIRVAEKKHGEWIVHAWIQKAILDFFRISKIETMNIGPFEYADKIPLKKNFAAQKVRVVPPAVARYGSFLEEGVILMPSYVNIGARVGRETMVDTWATVGSAAQIGSRVHLSGGVGIGGVLEPPGQTPVIIEDDVFVGSRCIIVEGMRVEEKAVLAANVTLTKSTPIVDIRTSEKKILKGVVPRNCVVVPGTMEKKINNHTAHISCVYIIGERKESTNLKTSLNDTLREYDLSV